MLQCCGICSPCLCSLSASASIHPPIPTFRGTAHALAVAVSSAHVHRQKWRPTAVHDRKTLELLSYVAVTLKTKRKSTTPENSLATGGCFECNTYRVVEQF